MTTATLAAPVVAQKNLQARSTVAILNIVRYALVMIFVVSAVVAVVVTIIGVVQGETTTVLLGLTSVVVQVILGALAYAFIGWYVDTLDMLKQIARNTAV